MNTVWKFGSWASLIALTLGGCGGGGGGGDGTRVSTQTVLMSSAVAASPGYRVQAQPLTVSTSCASGHAACLTPTSVSGMAYYAGIMVGTGGVGYSVGPILGDVIDPSQASSFALDELYPFDFAQGISIAGSATCCEGSPYPDDADAFAWRVHLYFGYVDTGFTLEAADGVAVALQGDHVVRAVFADIDGTAYKKGDLLYRTAAETDEDFKWCTIASGCTHTSRPADPIQYQDVATFTSSGQGNPTIPDFNADLSNQNRPQLTEAALTDPTKTWHFEVDFDIAEGVGFSSSPIGMAALHELIQAFELSAEPGSSNNGFTANLNVEVL